MLISGTIGIEEKVNAFLHSYWRQYRDVGHNDSEVRFSGSGRVEFNQVLKAECVAIAGSHCSGVATCVLQDYTKVLQAFYSAACVSHYLSRRDSASNAENGENAIVADGK